MICVYAQIAQTMKRSRLKTQECSEMCWPRTINLGKYQMKFPIEKQNLQWHANKLE